jgi:hypothetical protein
MGWAELQDTSGKSDSAVPQQAVVFPRAAMQIGRTAQVPIEAQLGPYQSTVNIIVVLPSLMRTPDCFPSVTCNHAWHCKPQCKLLCLDAWVL